MGTRAISVYLRVSERNLLLAALFEDALGVDGGESRERGDHQRGHHADQCISIGRREKESRVVVGASVPIALSITPHLSKHDTDDEKHESKDLVPAEAFSQQDPREERRRQQLGLHDDREERRLEPAERDKLEHLLAVVDTSGDEEAEEGAPVGAHVVEYAPRRASCAQHPHHADERLEALGGDHSCRVEKVGLAADRVAHDEGLGGVLHDEQDQVRPPHIVHHLRWRKRLQLAHGVRPHSALASSARWLVNNIVVYVLKEGGVQYTGVNRKSVTTACSTL